MNMTGFKYNNIRRIQGLTMLELLVAVTISLILMLGVGNIYFNSKRTYQVQEQFSRLQEGARIAMNFMVEDIRMAGFVGCAWNSDLDIQSVLNVQGAAEEDALSNFKQAITGFEATSSGPNDTVNLASPSAGWLPNTVPAYITQAPVAGSDMLIVRFADGAGANLAAPVDPARIFIDDEGDNNVDANDCHAATGICEDDLLIITDCIQSTLFQATNVTPTGGNQINIEHAASGTPGNAAPAAWGPRDVSYNPGDAKIFVAASYAYYVAMNNQVPPQPALFRQRMRPGSTPEELITGVENMQIMYGIDTDRINVDTGDGFANRYITGNQINAAVDNVVSARISLLIRTEAEVATKSTAAPVSKNFILNGMTAATGTSITSPADRHLRKVFTTTIKVRNKGT